MLEYLPSIHFFPVVPAIGDVLDTPTDKSLLGCVPKNFSSREDCHIEHFDCHTTIILSTPTSENSSSRNFQLKRLEVTATKLGVCLISNPSQYIFSKPTAQDLVAGRILETTF